MTQFTSGQSGDEEANLAVTERRGGPSGTLRVTAPVSVARRHVALAVAAFQNQYPTVRVAMRVTDRLVDIVEEGLDVAVRISRLEGSSLIALRICTGPRLLCASPAYLKRVGRPAHSERLSRHAYLTFLAPVDRKSLAPRYGNQNCCTPFDHPITP